MEIIKESCNNHDTITFKGLMICNFLRCSRNRVKIILKKFHFKAINKALNPNVFIAVFCIIEDLDKNLINTYKDFLTDSEINYMLFKTGEGNRHSYLLGRYAVKQAFSLYFSNDKFKQYSIFNSVLGYPYAKRITTNISITHAYDIGCAVVSDIAFPISLDMEILTSAKDIPVEYCTEIYLLNNLSVSLDEKKLIQWTAKEALSKSIRTGLTVPFDFFEISKCISLKEGITLIEFKNFPQYKAEVLKISSFVIAFAYHKLFESDIGKAFVN